MVYVIVPLVIWLFIAAATIVPIITIYKLRRAPLDVLKASIERGQDLSPEMLKQLSRIGEDKPMPPVHLMILGIIVCSVGLGAVVVASIFLFVLPLVSPYIYAGGGLMFCLGGGFIFASKMLNKHRQSEVTNQLDTNTDAQ